MWTALAFAVVGAIHLMPVAPVFVPETLSRLYGIAPTDSTLLVLMRHRALLLALVGVLCLWASWMPSVRPAALLAATSGIRGGPASADEDAAGRLALNQPLICVEYWTRLKAESTTTASINADNAMRDLLCFAVAVRRSRGSSARGPNLGAALK